MIDHLTNVIGLSIIGLWLLTAVLGLRDIVSNLPDDFTPPVPQLTTDAHHSGAGE